MVEGGARGLPLTCSIVISGRKWSIAATVFLDTSVMPQGTMLLMVGGVTMWRRVDEDGR